MTVTGVKQLRMKELRTHPPCCPARGGIAGGWKIRVLRDDGEKSKVCQACTFAFIDQDVYLGVKRVRNQSRGLDLQVIPLSNRRGSFPGRVYTLAHE